MRKDEFIKKLRRWLTDGDCGWKGQRPFVEYLVEYLTRLDLSHYERYEFQQLNHHIPQIMLDAFEMLRTETEDWVVLHRKSYENETGHPVPNITDIGASNSCDQSSAVQVTLGFMLKDALSDNFIEQQVAAYCNAQSQVIQQYFDRFLREVYRKGLFEIIEISTVKGMCGKFGNTELRSFSMAGRLMFTFARKEGDEETYASFIVEDGDPTGYSGGQGSRSTNFIQTLELLTDVTLNWPNSPDEQRKLYKDNKKVNLDIVVAVKAANKAGKRAKRSEKSAVA